MSTGIKPAALSVSMKLCPDKRGSIKSFIYFIPLALRQRFLISSVRASGFIPEERINLVRASRFTLEEPIRTITLMKMPVNYFRRADTEVGPYKMPNPVGADARPDKVGVSVRPS